MNSEKLARVYQVTAMEDRKLVPETRRGTTAVFKTETATYDLKKTMNHLESEEHYHILARRIETFTEKTQTDLECLREAITKADALGIDVAARRLTDHTGRMGAMKMMRLCIALQMLGQRNMITKAKVIAADLEQEFLNLKRTLVRAG